MGIGCEGIPAVGPFVDVLARGRLVQLVPQARGLDQADGARSRDAAIGQVIREHVLAAQLLDVAAHRRLALHVHVTRGGAAAGDGKEPAPVAGDHPGAGPGDRVGLGVRDRLPVAIGDPHPPTIPGRRRGRFSGSVTQQVSGCQPSIVADEIGRFPARTQHRPVQEVPDDLPRSDKYARTQFVRSSLTVARKAGSDATVASSEASAVDDVVERVGPQPPARPGGRRPDQRGAALHRHAQRRLGARPRIAARGPLAAAARGRGRLRRRLRAAERALALDRPARGAAARARVPAARRRRRRREQRPAGPPRRPAAGALAQPPLRRAPLTGARNGDRRPGLRRLHPARDAGRDVSLHAAQAVDRAPPGGIACDHGRDRGGADRHSARTSATATATAARCRCACGCRGRAGSSLG